MRPCPTPPQARWRQRGTPFQRVPGLSRPPGRRDGSDWLRLRPRASALIKRTPNLRPLMCFSVFYGGQGGTPRGGLGPGLADSGDPPAGGGPGLLQRFCLRLLFLGAFDTSGLGPPWDPPGTPLGPPWDPPGTPLGPPWDPPGTPLGPPWEPLGPFWDLPETPCYPLGPPWDPPGTPLGPPWDPPWDPPGPPETWDPP